MSACISREGEYSDHVLDDQFACTRCYVLAEEALLGSLAEAQKERDTAQQHIAKWLIDNAPEPSGKAGSLTGDLAVDMAAYAGRLKDRAEAAEADANKLRLVAGELTKALANANAEVARLRGGERCPHCKDIGRCGERGIDCKRWDER